MCFAPSALHADKFECRQLTSVMSYYVYLVSRIFRRPLNWKSNPSPSVVLRANNHMPESLRVPQALGMVPPGTVGFAVGEWVQPQRLPVGCVLCYWPPSSGG